MTALGCIADDFTGATDLAALLARSGARVALRIGVPAAPATDAAECEVVALKIRSAPAPEAVAQALAALDWLQAAGARRFYWKYCSTFDSTPQGNIGPVAEALMAALGTDRTLHAPSFPENGRRVFMGNLFVGRQPLAESPMKDHPLNPMTDSDLTRVLAAQSTLPVGLVDWPTVAAGAVRAAVGPGHWIGDAISDGDLATLAEAVWDWPLLSGGSAFAGKLPDRLRAAGLLGAGAASNRPRMPAGRAIVLSGSCSAMTRQQVAAYGAGAPAFRLDPLALARDGAGETARMRDWLAAQDHPAPLVYATAEPDQVRAAQAELGIDRAGRVVEAALAAAARAARDAGVARFVVAGGETSGAVTQALAVDRLDIGAEIAPGVPWCVARDAAGPLAVALKSGNFGGPDFFAEALAAAE